MERMAMRGLSVKRRLLGGVRWYDVQRSSTRYPEYSDRKIGGARTGRLSRIGSHLSRHGGILDELIQTPWAAIKLSEEFVHCGMRLENESLMNLFRFKGWEIPYSVHLDRIRCAWSSGSHGIAGQLLEVREENVVSDEDAFNAAVEQIGRLRARLASKYGKNPKDFLDSPENALILDAELSIFEFQRTAPDSLYSKLVHGVAATPEVAATSDPMEELEKALLDTKDAKERIQLFEKQEASPGTSGRPAIIRLVTEAMCQEGQQLKAVDVIVSAARMGLKLDVTDVIHVVKDLISSGNIAKALEITVRLEGLRNQVCMELGAEYYADCGRFHAEAKNWKALKGAFADILEVVKGLLGRGVATPNLSQDLTYIESACAAILFAYVDSGKLVAATHSLELLAELLDPGKISGELVKAIIVVQAMNHEDASNIMARYGDTKRSGKDPQVRLGLTEVLLRNSPELDLETIREEMGTEALSDTGATRIIWMLLANRRREDALALLNEVEDLADAAVYSAVLRMSEGDPEFSKQAFRQMIERRIQPPLPSLSSLIRTLISANDLSGALLTVDFMIDELKLALHESVLRPLFDRLDCPIKVVPKICEEVMEVVEKSSDKTVVGVSLVSAFLKRSELTSARRIAEALREGEAWKLVARADPQWPLDLLEQDIRPSLGTWKAALDTLRRRTDGKGILRTVEAMNSAETPLPKKELKALVKQCETADLTYVVEQLRKASQ